MNAHEAIPPLILVLTRIFILLLYSVPFCSILRLLMPQNRSWIIMWRSISLPLESNPTTHQIVIVGSWHVLFFLWWTRKLNQESERMMIMLMITSIHSRKPMPAKEVVMLTLTLLTEILSGQATRQPSIPCFYSIEYFVTMLSMIILHSCCVMIRTSELERLAICLTSCWREHLLYENSSWNWKMAVGRRSQNFQSILRHSKEYQRRMITLVQSMSFFISFRLNPWISMNAISRNMFLLLKFRRADCLYDRG